MKGAAQRASKASSPRSRIDMPTAVAIQRVVAIIPKVPRISERVVKRPMSMSLISGGSGKGVLLWMAWLRPGHTRPT